MFVMKELLFDLISRFGMAILATLLFVSYQARHCTHKTHNLASRPRNRAHEHTHVSAATHKEKHYVKMSHRQLQNCPLQHLS